MIEVLKKEKDNFTGIIRELSDSKSIDKLVKSLKCLVKTHIKIDEDSLEALIKIRSGRSVHVNSESKTIKKKSEKNSANSTFHVDDKTTKLIEDLEKANSYFSKEFYSQIERIYGISLYNGNFEDSFVRGFYDVARTAYEAHFDETLLTRFIHTPEYNYKKKKKANNLQEALVNYAHVESVDFDEIQEIQRVARMNAISYGSARTDPDAEERYKIWSKFVFNLVLSFIYYENALS